VQEIVIDAATDSADVTADATDAVSEAGINAALADASTGSGHTYRVAAGSWPAAQ
jgi:hypothetical protein